LKIWKPLGLSLRDPAGNIVAPNDPRLDDLWATAGELKVPVLIHVADPVAFFKPVDRFNERWEELYNQPDLHYLAQNCPRFEDLIAQLADLVTRHAATNFIGAHVGCYAENLEWVSGLIKRCPNFHVDISARIAELGRVPARARQFFISHADRILFGSDYPPNSDYYRLCYRFLESRDEYFPHWLGERPVQGRWMIYGLGLPADVLKKVYHDNAARLLHRPPLL
jgi:predicted TIM-barrel fold metal-dependent hydrolase